MTRAVSAVAYSQRRDPWARGGGSGTMSEPSDKVSMPVFDGKEEKWAVWKEKFLAVLDIKDLLGALLQADPPGEEGSPERKAWQRAMLKIYSYLVACTKDSALDLVVQHTKTRAGGEAWQALVDKYEQKGVAGRVALMTELMSASLEPGEDPDRFFGRLESLKRRLKEVNAEIAWDILRDIALAKLPESYATLVTILESQDDLKYDDVKKRVRDAYSSEGFKIKQELEASSKAFMAKNGRSKDACSRCGEIGHWRRDCPKKQEDDAGKKAAHAHLGVTFQL